MTDLHQSLSLGTVLIWASVPNLNNLFGTSPKMGTSPSVQIWALKHHWGPSGCEFHYPSQEKTEVTGVIYSISNFIGL